MPASDPLAFPPPSMWPGRAALYRPATRPPKSGHLSAPAARSAAPAFWLVSRAACTLVIEERTVRLSCGGVDAVCIDMTCADVAAVVLGPERAGAGGGSGGGGGRAAGGRAVFAASATYTDSATGQPHALKFAFCLERLDDGPRLAAAWRALKAAAEGAAAAVAAGAVAPARPQPSPPPPPAATPATATLPSFTAAPGGGPDGLSLDTKDGCDEGGDCPSEVVAAPPPSGAAGAAVSPSCGPLLSPPAAAAGHPPSPPPGMAPVQEEDDESLGVLEERIRVRARRLDVGGAAREEEGRLASSQPACFSHPHLTSCTTHLPPFLHSHGHEINTQAYLEDPAFQDDMDRVAAVLDRLEAEGMEE